MQLDEIYRASRLRLIELADELTPAQAETVVASCPAWTVTDVYRHLTGLAADVLDGNLSNRGTPAWTAAQVAARADRTLAEVCAEWAERGPDFETLFATTGQTNMRACFDINAHEKDVLGAIGRRGDRNDPALASLVDLMFGMYARAQFPVPLRFEVGDRAVNVGGDEPELTLRTDPYEFMRIVLGRRSEAQLARADWSGPDPQRVFAALSPFPLPTTDIVD